MNSNSRTPAYFTSDAKGVIPSSTIMTGTISSSGTVITGTNTKFLSEIRGGKGQINNYFVYSPTNSEVRRIVAVYSDTRFDVDRAFSTSLSGEVFHVVRGGRLNKISIDNTRETAGKVSTPDHDNQDLAGGDKAEFTNERGMGLNPVAYDASTGTIFAISVL